MKVLSCAALATCLAFGSTAISEQSVDPPDPAALTSAESFLHLLDESKWQEAYDAGQFPVDFSVFDELIVSHRKDRGVHSDRQFVEEKPRLGDPGDESIKKTELVFETTFEDGLWTETVIVTTRGGGPWVVEGYTIGHRRSE